MVTSKKFEVYFKNFEVGNMTSTFYGQQIRVPCVAHLHYCHLKKSTSRIHRQCPLRGLNFLGEPRLAAARLMRKCTQMANELRNPCCPAAMMMRKCNKPRFHTQR